MKGMFTTIPDLFKEISEFFSRSIIALSDVTKRGFVLSLQETKIICRKGVYASLPGGLAKTSS
jgi:hypothetical protein